MKGVNGRPGDGEAQAVYVVTITIKHTDTETQAAEDGDKQDCTRSSRCCSTVYFH